MITPKSTERSMTDYERQPVTALGEEGVTTIEQQNEQQISSCDAGNMSTDAVTTALENILADVGPDLKPQQWPEIFKGINKRIAAITTETSKKHHLITAVGQLTNQAQKITNNADLLLQEKVEAQNYFRGDYGDGYSRDWKRLHKLVREFVFAVAPRQTPSPAEAASNDRYRSIFASVSPDYARFLAEPYDGKGIIIKAAVWDYVLSELNKTESLLWAGSIGLAYDQVRAYLMRKSFPFSLILAVCLLICRISKRRSVSLLGYS